MNLSDLADFPSVTFGYYVDILHIMYKRDQSDALANFEKDDKDSVIVGFVRGINGKVASNSKCMGLIRYVVSHVKGTAERLFSDLVVRQSFGSFRLRTLFVLGSCQELSVGAGVLVERHENVDSVQLRMGDSRGADGEDEELPSRSALLFG